MNGVYLIIITFFIIAVILITVVLVALKKHQNKVIRSQVERLDREKNLIASTPVYSELSKVESIVKNDQMEEKYKNWQKRFEVIKNEKINNISDMINELDIMANMKDYKNFDSKIAKVEMEVYKVRENANELLDEIKEITVSDEKFRTIVTKLKSKYRTLNKEYSDNKEAYLDIGETIELQFETIEKRFLDFDKSMEKNDYDEVTHIVKALDTLIEHIEIAIKEVPNFVLLSEKIIPKRIEEIQNSNKKMVKEGFNLQYLNIKYNMSECKKNIKTIVDKIKVLNLDDCMFELKTLLDYLDGILDSLEKEKSAKKLYLEIKPSFDNKYKDVSKKIKEVYKSLDELKQLYDLDDIDVDGITSIKKKLDSINNDYKKLIDKEENRKEPYTILVKELIGLDDTREDLNILIEQEIDSLGRLHEDELRAREQLTETRTLLKQCKLTMRSYKLPIIASNYFVELEEAREAIKEIEKELDKKPIDIKVLNTRVDTARDLVLKLYRTTTEMIKTAELAEMAIVYGNRFRATHKEVDKGLENASMLFSKGNYKDALDISLSSIELVESDIKEKLLKLYE